MTRLLGFYPFSFVDSGLTKRTFLTRRNHPIVVYSISAIHKVFSDRGVSYTQVQVTIQYISFHIQTSQRSLLILRVKQYEEGTMLPFFARQQEIQSQPFLGPLMG